MSFGGLSRAGPRPAGSIGSSEGARKVILELKLYQCINGWERLFRAVSPLANQTIHFRRE